MLALMILALFNGLGQTAISATVDSPSILVFEQLQAEYPTKLSCPCERVAVPYSTFVSVTVSYHQVSDDEACCLEISVSCSMLLDLFECLRQLDMDPISVWIRKQSWWLLTTGSTSAQQILSDHSSSLFWSAFDRGSRDIEFQHDHHDEFFGLVKRHFSLSNCSHHQSVHSAGFRSFSTQYYSGDRNDCDQFVSFSFQHGLAGGVWRCFEWLCHS